MTADLTQASSSKQHLWILLGLAALSGLLLFVSDYPLHLWPLQALALLPLLIGLLRCCHSKKAALLAGLTLGAVSLVPMAWSSARSTERTLKVAAIGWTWDDLPGGGGTPALRVYREVYLPRVERAVKAGAKLIVSPEVGFTPAASGRAAGVRATRDCEGRCGGL